MVVGHRDKSTVNLCQSLGPAKVQKFLSCWPFPAHVCWCWILFFRCQVNKISQAYPTLGSFPSVSALKYFEHVYKVLLYQVYSLPHKSFTVVIPRVLWTSVFLVWYSFEACVKVECNFPSIAIHSGLQQDERIARWVLMEIYSSRLRSFTCWESTSATLQPPMACLRLASFSIIPGRYKQFKEFQKRILVATDLFGRGIDIERAGSPGDCRTLFWIKRQREGREVLKDESLQRWMEIWKTGSKLKSPNCWSDHCESWQQKIFETTRWLLYVGTTTKCTKQTSHPDLQSNLIVE